VNNLGRGTSGSDLYLDVELWRLRVYCDETLLVQTVSERVDWPSLGASAPAFDISVTFFNGTSTWRWPW
jgi:hypothetical protein